MDLINHPLTLPRIMYVLVMVTASILVWVGNSDVTTPAPCASLMLVFAWCAYHIGESSDGLGDFAGLVMESFSERGLSLPSSCGGNANNN